MRVAVVSAMHTLTEAGMVVAIVILIIGTIGTARCAWQVWIDG